MSCAHTRKQPFPLCCPIALLSISNICATITPAIASKVSYFVALVAPLGARAIVVEMALGALGQRSPIRLPFTCPHVVDFGDILPLAGLFFASNVLVLADLNFPINVVRKSTDVTCQPSRFIGQKLGFPQLDSNILDFTLPDNILSSSFSMSTFQVIAYATGPAVAVSGVLGDRSHVHTHDHDGSEAPDESPDSILSSEPKPLREA
ncbi:hypothetical protein Tco_1538409 [Tanacetum coccineum]